LNLHKNSISGVIPFNLEYLKELVVLDLSFNKLTGTIPSSERSNLVILQLYMNRLSGELPTQIGNLKHLETLAVLIMN
jgi:Leucine-rich repeat (LRR) protein